MSINKIVASGVVAVSIFGATVASAQTYYPTYTTGSGACVSLTSDLSYGQKGSNVTQLQNFLVAQNYPGGGSWMVTGYFGSATVAAVRNFQQAQGLPMTGSVDASTRAAISRVSCGTGYNNQSYLYTNNTYNQGYPYNYNNYTNSYPYNYNYNFNSNYNYNSCGTFPYYTSCISSYGTTPHLTSLSVTAAPAGAPVTVFGTGFDPIANTVYVGGTTLSNISSNNTTSLTFTVPANATGATSVSVGNSHGTSNALTLTIGNYGYPYNNYPPNTPCGYGYTYNCLPNTGVPTVSYLSPNTGSVGTSVTVYGAGFSSTGNTVHFGNGVISNLLSTDGHSVSFTVPSTISGYGYQPIGLGSYDVSVSNNVGVLSNTMPFTITSLGSTGAATITNVSGPNSLGVSVSGNWIVTVQNPGNNYITTSVSWGDTGNGYVNMAAPQITYTSGATTLTFTHAYFAAGTYTVTFTVSNASGQQNTSSATVYVSSSGNTGSVTLSAISPNSGHIGTQVMLQGSGFSSLDNTVHFGIGGTQHIPSANGTTIYYTIPQYVSPCDVAPYGGVCAQNIQQIMAGPVQMYVTNSNGTTQVLMFQVN
jgi:peptidoglycan hydrolase-like protein with peptidoglycan-binding domain